MEITVNALIGLLAQQAIWKYELKFVGFSNKYTAIVQSITPQLTKDGKVLLEIYAKEPKEVIKVENGMIVCDTEETEE